MVVTVGVTVFDVKPSTEPTSLLIESVVGAPPESDQKSVADWPRAMILESAVNEVIIGEGGLTVTVKDLVTTPEIF